MLIILLFVCVNSSPFDVSYGNDDKSVVAIHYDTENIVINDIFGCTLDDDAPRIGCDMDNTLRVHIPKGNIRAERDHIVITNWKASFKQLRINYNNNINNDIIPQQKKKRNAPLKKDAPLEKDAPLNEDAPLDEDNVYLIEENSLSGIYFIGGVGIALTIFIIVKIYLRIHLPGKVQQPIEPEIKRKIKNVKKANILGVYRPGTIIRTETKQTTFA